MRMRILGPAAAALLLALAVPAHAAPPTPEERCEALQEQWKHELPLHLQAPELQKAKSMHAEGFTLCLAGKTTEGVLKLKEALHDLGVQPEI